MEKRKKKRKKEEIIREFSAGGVVYKKKDKRIFWLIALSSTSNLYPKSYWRLPKGWLDDERGSKTPGPLARGERRAKEQDIQKAALREVAEEGGVRAKIVKKIGTEKIFFTRKSGQGILKFVTYYLMKYLQSLPEGPGFETSEIKFLPYKKARKLIKYSGEKKILDKAREILAYKR